MSPQDYEKYVEQAVRQLDLGPDTEIRRNAILPGVRQRGRYEIDVAVKSRLSGTIDFLMIVECKNWSRPVDRPIVQNIAQTRDAVGAHKAAVVSPVGFSEEAIAVAQDLGVALWVLSETQWTIVLGSHGPSREAWRPYVERKRFLQELGLGIRPRTDAPQTLALIDVSAAKNVDGASDTGADTPQRYVHSALGGSFYTDGDDEPGVDPRLASSMLADDCARLLQLDVVPGCRSRR